MNSKKDLSERDIITKYILPAIENAGWDKQTQIREEVTFTDGRCGNAAGFGICGDTWYSCRNFKQRVRILDSIPKELRLFRLRSTTVLRLTSRKLGKQDAKRIAANARQGSYAGVFCVMFALNVVKWSNGGYRKKLFRYQKNVLVKIL